MSDGRGGWSSWCLLDDHGDPCIFSACTCPCHTGDAPAPAARRRRAAEPEPEEEALAAVAKRPLLRRKSRHDKG